MIQPDDVQTGWILAQVEIARQTNQYPKIALVVACHESACGTSHVATAHNNLHGIKAVNGQPASEDGVYRHFETEIESWKAFNYLLTKSSYYARVRKVAAEKSLPQKKRDEAILRAMYGIYCSRSDWIRGVRDWLDVVWRLLPARSGPIVPPGELQADGVP